MTIRRWWPLLGALALIACGGGDGGSDAGGQPDGQPAEAAADTATTPEQLTPDTAVPDAAVPDAAAPDTAVEAETHATPVAPTLTSAHAGWKNPACLSCHSYDAHNDGDDPYLCAGCHGTNGAPKGHTTGGCGCHAGKHGEQGFPSPLSCTTCHPK